MKGNEKLKNIIKKKEMSLKRLGYIMSAVFLLISLLLIILSIITLNKNKYTNDDTHKYIVLQENIRELQAGTDELTYDARAFTVTADKSFAENYFNELTVTKRRDNALASLEEDFKNNDLYKHLALVMESADNLVEIELYSIRLVVEAKGYSLRDFPAEIQNVELREEDIELTPEEQLELAETMVVDKRYQSYKESIENEIQSLVRSLAETTENKLNKSFSDLTSLLIFQVILVSAIVLTVVIEMVLMLRNVIAPLIEAADRIDEEKPLKLKGAKEYLLLAKAYNKMSAQQVAQKELLKYEATHDLMTGLFNRAGFENICAISDATRAAMMMIDVDDFKSINDTYGHHTGDQTLIAISNELKISFRAEDKVCRIGGDEFIIVMNNVSDSPQLRMILKDKVSSINRSLSRLHGNGVPVSISCGVAFGTPDDTAETLKKKADNVLYLVKSHGKQDVGFEDSFV